MVKDADTFFLTTMVTTTTTNTGKKEHGDHHQDEDQAVVNIIVSRLANLPTSFSPTTTTRERTRGGQAKVTYHLPQQFWSLHHPQSERINISFDVVAICNNDRC
jgi:hypothetical protein